MGNMSRVVKNEAKDEARIKKKKNTEVEDQLCNLQGPLQNVTAEKLDVSR